MANNPNAEATPEPNCNTPASTVVRGAIRQARPVTAPISPGNTRTIIHAPAAATSWSTCAQ